MVGGLYRQTFGSGADTVGVSAERVLSDSPPSRPSCSTPTKNMADLHQPNPAVSSKPSGWIPLRAQLRP